MMSLLAVLSCQKDEAVSPDGGELVIHMAAEPDRINPVLSTSSLGSQIDRFVFQALYDFNPYTLEYIPVLAEADRELRHLGAGDSSQMHFTYNIKEEASWEDGEEVLADDYVFSLKAIFNPKVNAARMRSYLSFIDSVITYPEDPRKISLITDGDYFLNEQIVSNFMILPRHIYDPDSLLDEIELADLMDPGRSEELAEDEKVNRFAAGFNGQEFSREIVKGSGPYRFVEWVPGQRLVLEKKEDWWGESLEGANPFFQAYPRRIIYRFIPDETVALTSLKDGNIDVMSQVSPENFLQLKGDSADAGKYYFHTPTLMQFIYIALNTADPKLSDKGVRQALAHLVDMNFIVEDLFKGFAQPVVGAINPQKDYYHPQLQPREMDPDKAEDLLEAAGWDDSDGDGIVDKLIGEEEVELELTLEVSGELGEKLALGMQESFREAGVDLKLERKAFSLIREGMRKGEYEMAALLLSQSPAMTDLYQSWHSSNVNQSGGNLTGFGTVESDSIISAIRVEEDPDIRNKLYRRIQEIMYEETPAIFLVSPQGRVLVSREWEFRPAVLRPGIFEQNLRLAKDMDGD